MTLNEALDIVNVYITFGEKRENFDTALEIVWSSAEDWQYFAKGKSRAEYRAYLQSRGKETVE